MSIIRELHPVWHPPHEGQFPPPHLWAGLHLLARARAYAEVARASVWDFSVEINCLKEAGLDTTDLRLLVSLGWVEHADQIPPRGEAPFGPPLRGRTTFTDRSCFVLTEAGAVSLQASAVDGRIKEELPLMPRYDLERRELRLGNWLVKRFRQPSAAQEGLLQAFEAKAWPALVDDPLSRVPGLEPKRRLHDTVKSLNRNQRQRVIQFHVTGNGRKVGWNLLCRADRQAL